MWVTNSLAGLSINMKLKEKSGDHESHQDASSGNREYLISEDFELLGCSTMSHIELHELL